MKRKVEHPAPSERSLSGPKYWRSLDELAATPGFQAQLEREFPQAASEMNGVDRRHFKVIGILAVDLDEPVFPVAGNADRSERRLCRLRKTLVELPPQWTHGASPS